jgi:hypothetical protein
MSYMCISRLNNSFGLLRDYKPLPLISHYQSIKMIEKIDLVKRFFLTNKILLCILDTH